MSFPFEARPNPYFNRYVAFLALLVLGAVLVLAVITYNLFLVHVPVGKMLVLIAKSGDPLPDGAILAKPGQKGILEDVLGEGLHFVMPLSYDYERHDVTIVPPGKIGVVVSKVGKVPPPGSIVVADDERGLRRRVLTPGAYRLNPHGYQITLREATVIPPGYVGCVTSRVGAAPKGQFAGPGERGIRERVLQPGIYYLNPYEFEVAKVEVGINQVNFLDANEIRFPSRDAFDIKIEATVEWELLPENVAKVVAEFGGREAVEEKVIIPQSKSIGRIQGSSYGAKDFLLGAEREKFQRTFTRELEKTCASKSITIHSAFIRHLVIPDSLLLPIRETFIAVEREKTAKAWDETKKSAGDLARERSRIEQSRREVQAGTEAVVKTIEAEADQEAGTIEAELRLEVAQKQEEIAKIEAEKTVLLGDARAQVTKLQGDATAEGMQLKIQAFGDNPRAYAHWRFSQQLPPKLNLRLIHAGEGTMWTDLRGATGLPANMNESGSGVSIPDAAGLKTLRRK